MLAMLRESSRRYPTHLRESVLGDAEVAEVADGCGIWVADPPFMTLLSSMLGYRGVEALNPGELSMPFSNTRTAPSHGFQHTLPHARTPRRELQPC